MTEEIIQTQIKVNPDVQRAVQHLSQGVSDGKITGVVFVGVTADGQVISAHALPATPSMIYLGIGALQGLISDLTDCVKQLRQQQQVSRIIKPNMMHHHG